MSTQCCRGVFCFKSQIDMRTIHLDAIAQLTLAHRTLKYASQMAKEVRLTLSDNTVVRQLTRACGWQASACDLSMCHISHILLP